ncbi:MAG: ankyrin repeat domain-containing protein [Phycisphaerae bacterium]
MTHEQAKTMIEQTPLIAASHGDLAQVQALFDAQPGLVEALNALTPAVGEETPQRAAAHARQLPILSYFLERGVQPDLFMACALGMTDLMEMYLTAHPKEIEAKGAHGIALLVHANDPAVVELLLRHGVDPSLALVQLAWSGKVELMQVALDRGAQVDSPTQGRRPLHIAAAQGHLAAVELLLKAGANVQVRARGGDWEFKTALGLALMNGHTKVADLLRKHTPPPPPRRVPQGAPGRFRR